MRHSLGCQGHVSLGQLPDLLARFEQRGVNVCQAVEAQECQVVLLLVRAAPAADDNRELGKTDPQPLAEIARLGEATGWYQANTDEGWSPLLYQRDHFGGQQGGPGDLDRKPPGIEGVLQHLERHLVGLVMGWTPQDAGLR